MALLKNSLQIPGKKTPSPSLSPLFFLVYIRSESCLGWLKFRVGRRRRGKRCGAVGHGGGKKTFLVERHMGVWLVGCLAWRKKGGEVAGGVYVVVVVKGEN